MVTLFAGSPTDAATANVRELEISLEDVYYAGLDGLRLVIGAISEHYGEIVERASASHQAEWNVLFPGSFADSPPMSALAATCSERRLHAESHQLFRIVNAVQQLVIDVAAVDPDAPLRIVLRGGRFLDVPSLRGLLRLIEPSCGAQVVLADLLGSTMQGSLEGIRAHQRAQQAFLERVGEPIWPGGSTPLPAADFPASSPERDWWNRTERADGVAERIGSALVTMRAAFFSTNYRGGVTAAYLMLDSLRELELHAEELDVDRVRAVVAGAEIADDPGSIGLGVAEVVDAAGLTSVAHRYLGMTWSFLMDYLRAEQHFALALEHGSSPALRAGVRLLRALLRIKRMSDMPAGFEDVRAGLADLESDSSEEAAIEGAWLYNVWALGYVQLRDAAAAEHAERKAIRLVAKRSSTDATHLKVNLISNLSVLAEHSGDPGRALDIWQRFTRAPGTWSPTFVKNFSYREGSLLARLRRVDDALAALARAREAAAETGDEYYGAYISLGAASLLVSEHRFDEAGSWYRHAEQHADRINDDFLRGLARIGLALNRSDAEAPREEVARGLCQLLDRGLSHPREAAELAEALRNADLQACRESMPTVNRKLNRPFTPVRLELHSVS